MYICELIFRFFCPGSIYTMMAVAIERYITVCHPFFKITHNWGAYKWVDDDFWIFAFLHHQVHSTDLRLFIGVQCAEILRTEGWGGSRLVDFPALFFQLLSYKMSWVRQSTSSRQALITTPVWLLYSLECAKNLLTTTRKIPRRFDSPKFFAFCSVLLRALICVKSKITYLFIIQNRLQKNS